MGATLNALKTASGVRIQYVIAIEGYDRLITDGDPAAALVAWAATEWEACLPGLRVAPRYQQRIEPLSDRLNVQSLTFSVVPDADDRFGIDTHRKDGGAETFLEAALDCEDTTISVASAANFPSSGTVQIGTETIAYTGKTATTLTGATRGLYAPFKAESETEQRFGHPHSLPALGDTFGVSIKPLVTQHGRNWIGRRVGIWMHRVVGGVLDVRVEAHLVWAGRIADVNDDAGTGETVIEAVEVKGEIKDATILRDQYVARVLEGIDIPNKILKPHRIHVTQFHSGESPPFDEEVSLTFVGSPSAGNEEQAGRYTIEELVSTINSWIAFEVSEGNLDGEWEVKIQPQDEGGSRFTLGLSPTSTPQPNHRIRMRSSVAIMRFLGFSEYDSPADWESDSAARPVIVSHGVPLRTMPAQGDDAIITIEASRGTWFDNLGHLPAGAFGVAQGLSPGGDWGVVELEGGLYLVERVSATQFAHFRPVVSAELGLPLVVSPRVFARDGITYDEAGEDIEIRQVVIFGNDGFAEIVTQMLTSTGTADYNGDHDSLPEQLGAGIPSELLPELEESLQALVSGDAIWHTALILLDRPTKLWDLIKSDLVLRRAGIVWSAGLEVRQVNLPTTAKATIPLPESRKGSPFAADPQGTPTRTTNEWMANVIKIEYDRNLEGEYRKTLTIRHGPSVQAHGEHAVTIEARNAYGATADANVEALAIQLAAEMLPVLAMPLTTMRAPVSPNLFEQVAPGDVLLVTDAFPRDPDTGRRRVTDRPATVFAMSADWGDPLLGEVDFFFADLDRFGVYSPAAELDPDGFGNGGYDEFNTIRCRPHAFTDAGHDDVDASFFAAGDVITVREIDPSDPSSPLGWNRIVASVSGSDIVMDGDLLSFDPDKQYRVISRSFADAVTIQRTNVYQAGDDGTIQGERVPYRYAQVAVLGSFAADEPTEPERHAELYFDDGAPMTPGQHRMMTRAADSLLAPWTGLSSGNLRRSDFDAGAADAWHLVEVRRIHVGRGLLWHRTRRLSVAPMMRMIGAGPPTQADLRVTLAHFLPIGNSTEDATLLAMVGRVEFSVATTTYTIPAAKEIDLPQSHPIGLLYLLTEVKPNTRTRGLVEVNLGPLVTP